MFNAIVSPTIKSASRFVLSALVVFQFFTTASLSWAQPTGLKVMEVLFPSDTTGQSMQTLQANKSLEASIQQPVQIDVNTDLTNALRATRTGEYDAFIAPAHVVASALSHGYDVVAANGTASSFVLVVKPEIQSVADLKNKKIYLPHQDSLASYMAKGLMNEAGAALSQFAKVDYQRMVGPGLVAIRIGTHDATVVRKKQFLEWENTNKGAAKILLESPPVAGDLSVAIRKNLPEKTRANLILWFTSKATSKIGSSDMKPIVNSSTLTSYTYLANLGHFTPTALPQVERINAVKAAALMKEGALLVDVRSEKEYKHKRIAGSLLAPYIEKSIKETTYKAEMDDFSAVAKLDKNKPIILACNGAECWKSYKASRAAVGMGFKKVYWLRGGVPEWETERLPLAYN